MNMRVFVGITGASGTPYAVRLLSALRDAGVSLFIAVSRNGMEIMRHECGDVNLKSFGRVYDNDDLSAPVCSGSFHLDAAVVIPASCNTISRIAYGLADTVITRVALVCLKEGRKLVVVPRETPVAAPTLRAMTALAEMGVVVLPASPAFYHRPRSVDDMLDFIAGRVMDALGISNDLYTRWSGAHS